MSDKAFCESKGGGAGRSFTGRDDKPISGIYVYFSVDKYLFPLWEKKGFPGGSVVTNLPANAGDAHSIPGSGKSTWRRKWQPTPVFLPGESHGQMSLAGYSPWGHKESDVT